MPLITHQIELAGREYELHLFTWYRAIEANQMRMPGSANQVETLITAYVRAALLTRCFSLWLKAVLRLS